MLGHFDTNLLTKTRNNVKKCIPLDSFVFVKQINFILLVYHITSCNVPIWLSISLRMSDGCYSILFLFELSCHRDMNPQLQTLGIVLTIIMDVLCCIFFLQSAGLHHLMSERLFLLSFSELNH